jgi:hypothetical protein
MLAHMHRFGGSRLRRASCSVVALVAAIALLGAASSPAVTAAASTRTCGYFFSTSHQDVIVYAGATTSCTTAKGIIKAFWANTGFVQHGTSDADSYWSASSWPGWRCIQSMGEGSCSKAKTKKLATYMVKL